MLRLTCPLEWPYCLTVGAISAFFLARVHHVLPASLPTASRLRGTSASVVHHRKLFFFLDPVWSNLRQVRNELGGRILLFLPSYFYAGVRLHGQRARNSRKSWGKLGVNAQSLTCSCPLRSTANSGDHFEAAVCACWDNVGPNLL
jgi:hypothetical protein